MAIFITLHQKVLLHQGAIDIHFPDLGRWRSIMYPCPISQEYLWAPSAKTVRAAAVQALVAPGGKVRSWSLTMCFVVIRIFLSYDCERILSPLCESSDTLLRSCHPGIGTFCCCCPLLFRFPMGRKKNKYTWPLQECWNLRFSIFSYGKEIWVSKSPICWYMYNKASGWSAIT